MNRLIVITGSGTGVDSGIRTFRTDEKTGKALWGEYGIEEVCELGAFRRGYEIFRDVDCAKVGLNVDKDGLDYYTKTHQFYNKRREELAGVEPNVAHEVIADLYKQYGREKVINITTNVDDLLERAGIPKGDILHVHGYLPEIVYRGYDGTRYEELVHHVGYSPVDPNTFDWVKPNVCFFGEVPRENAYEKMHEKLERLSHKDLVLVVGCSGQVIPFSWYISSKSEYRAETWEVNPVSSEEFYSQKIKMTSSEFFTNKDYLDKIHKHLKG